MTVTPESWKPGLQALEQEWRRALLHGFTRDEIDLQVAAMRTSQQNSAQREKTRTTGALVNGILSAIQNDTVFATPSSGLARFEGWADEVTPEMVHAGLQEVDDGGETALLHVDHGRAARHRDGNRRGLGGERKGRGGAAGCEVESQVRLHEFRQRPEKS